MVLSTTQSIFFWVFFSRRLILSDEGGGFFPPVSLYFGYSAKLSFDNCFDQIVLA